MAAEARRQASRAGVGPERGQAPGALGLLDPLLVREWGKARGVLAYTWCVCASNGAWFRTCKGKISPEETPLPPFKTDTSGCPASS